MQLDRVKLENFRNLSTTIELASPFGLVLGPNNAGKSNLVDALRLALTPVNGPREQHYAQPTDLARDKDGTCLSDSFTIEMHFSRLAEAEKGRLVTCLAPSLGDDCAKIIASGSLDKRSRVRMEWSGGDTGSPIEEHARTAVQYAYLHPLRDAAADLRPGRTQRIAALIDAIAGDGVDREAIEKVMSDANASLDEIGAITKATDEIDQRLKRMTGSSYPQAVGLRFADPVFERIVGAMRAMIGDHTPGEMAENGLGFNNLLYISTLLSSLASDDDPNLILMLVEEPEAHLHPQLQDLLLQFLREESGLHVQVLATSHSPNFSSGAGPEALTILGRRSPGEAVVARAIKDLQVDDDHLFHLQRFLDVTKSSLLFCRGVILVEGLAEQLMVPVLAEKLGINLVEHGVAVVNVGSLAFAPFAALFQDGRLPQPCSILTDGDPPEPDDEESDDGSDDEVGNDDDNGDVESNDDVGDDDSEGGLLLSAAAQRISELEDANVKVYIADQTFEWDFVNAGNWEIALRALALVHPRKAKRLEKDVPDGAPAQAEAILTAVKKSKGRFAQALTKVIDDDPEAVIHVPEYLQNGIRWPAGIPATAEQIE